MISSSLRPEQTDYTHLFDFYQVHQQHLSTIVMFPAVEGGCHPIHMVELLGTMAHPSCCCCDLLSIVRPNNGGVGVGCHDKNLPRHLLIEIDDPRRIWCTEEHGAVPYVGGARRPILKPKSRIDYSFSVVTCFMFCV